MLWNNEVKAAVKKKETSWGLEMKMQEKDVWKFPRKVKGYIRAWRRFMKSLEGRLIKM